jgi:hypothetical protein
MRTSGGFLKLGDRKIDFGRRLFAYPLVLRVDAFKRIGRCGSLYQQAL